ncbi:carbamoyltransferase C-terminal domain-containing protein [Streptomyces sp. NPDC005322]|uniref:carbamoyltransferase family protein n=1 Tax=unclassified Streptomyces TaxID=2593676 RepID=UPI0033AA60EA
MSSTVKGQTPVVLGISCSHDASACLMRGGEIVCAVQLERITRIKRDGRPYLNTRAAADYCLEAAGLTLDDVDLFAFNTQNLVPTQVGLNFPFADETFDLFDPVGERSVFVSHHLAHAFATFFSSPFDRSAVWVVDGSGGSVIGADDLLLRGPELAEYVNRPMPVPRPPYHVESAYVFDRSGYRLVERGVAASFHPMCGSSSLGETYASVSQYVFGDWQEGGKLMGLAPYGEASRFGESLLTKDDSGTSRFTSAWKQGLRRANRRGNPMEYRDLAARVQADLEVALVERASRVLELTSEADLAYAGGVALNSVANQRIIRESGVRRFYAMPASHDAGVSVGVAAAAHYVLTGETKGAPVTHDFLGKPYRTEEIDAALNRWNSVLRTSGFDQKQIVERLAEGQVIGWFEGGSEFGPRALGHRSIMAAPFERAMWEHLNRSIKYREEFRPYAPVVPVELADTFFDMGPDDESPYMLRVVQVRPEWRDRLGAVTHVDGSARVQTVDRVSHPRWHALLTAFGERTGIPVLVNTSMNVRGEPIAETPAQAIDVLLATQMDALVIGDRVVAPAAPVDEAIEDGPLFRAPGVELSARVGESGPEYQLTSRARSGLVKELPLFAFLLLAGADGVTPLRDLLKLHCPDASQRSEALRIVRDLLTERLLLAGGRAAAHAWA